MIAAVLGRDRLLLVIALLLATTGLIALQGMPKQEDPTFPYRLGIVTAAYPGAEAATVARLVARPIERELMQEAAVDEVTTTARQGLAVISVALRDDVYDTEPEWMRVRAALERARAELPVGVPAPQLDDRVFGAVVAVYAVTGGAAVDRRAAAIRLRDRLARIEGVSVTRLSGDPGEELAIDVSASELAALGLDPAALAQAVAARNLPSATGTLQGAGRSLPVTMELDFADLAELAGVPVPLPGGAVVPLGAIAEITRATPRPALTGAWLDGVPAVAVEVRATPDQVDVLELGARLRVAAAAVGAEVAPLAIEEMFYQPTYTAERMRGLLGTLLTAMALIFVVLVAAMGLRPALVVATMLPVVTLATLAVYAMGGGVLQQIAVIGMVVALGILVDNAIVVVEGVQRRLDAGDDRVGAMRNAVGELAGPLLAATGTTVAAFMPLLLSSGSTADFTRGIPLAVTLGLVVSYAFAVLVMPLVAGRVLQPRQAPARERVFEWIAASAVGLVARRPRLTVLAGTLALGGSLAVFPLLEQQFFPEADRAAVLVELRLPSGTTMDTTGVAAARVEDFLRTDPRVGSVHRFTGFSGPAFYYNLSRTPREPERARLLVETAGLAHNRELVARVLAWSAEALPGVEVIPVILRQGPPTNAPVELRVYHEDRRALVAATETVAGLLQEAPGTRNVRHSLGQGVPALDVALPAGWPERQGLGPAAVSQWLLASTQGYPAGSYRAGEESVPIQVRMRGSPYLGQADIVGLPIRHPDGRMLPVAQLAAVEVAIRPELIERRNQRQYASVSAELDAGVGYAGVLEGLRAALDVTALPAGTVIEQGGEAEASGEANSAIVTAAPLGALVFLFFVLVQFNSLRRVGIVLASLPLAAAGVFPALLLSGSAFGFQPLQGLIALVGITVNNAILLLSAVDDRLRDGTPLDRAIEDALRRRTRPILVTSATTIVGLLPLVWSDSTLWPPMAWAMIGGLVGAALLSITMLPVMIRAVLGWRWLPDAMRARPAAVASNG
ncbi:MAG: efflux RND transporter permease subunit [Pseudomonadales bacterium]|nr:efflux RND transporter permease subunit [Pseudomonadales bacterium]